MTDSPPLIVIANHDRMYLELMMEILTEAGYQIIIADSGANAYHVIRKHHADMAILAIPMLLPDAPLITLTMLRLDPTTTHIPVLICSTTTDLVRNNRTRFEEMDCLLLAKPFRLPELLACISEMIGQSKL